MPPVEPDQPLQEFLDEVRDIARSRVVVALVTNPAQFATAFHQQVGARGSAGPALPAHDVAILGRIVTLAASDELAAADTALGASPDASPDPARKSPVPADRPLTFAVSLAAVRQALHMVTQTGTVPARLVADWDEAAGRIRDYLAVSGSLPEVPTGPGTGTRQPSDWSSAGTITRADVLRTVLAGLGGEHGERGDTFRTWITAPPFFTIVENLFVAALADLIQTLAAMARYIVQPALESLASPVSSTPTPAETP